MPDGEELSGVGRTSGARNEHVAQLMKDAVVDGKCAFCSPYFEEKNGERVIALDGRAPRHWKVWHNPSPFDGTDYHIMLAPNEHVLLAADLLSAALYERNLIIEKLQLQFGYASFTEMSRQGKPDFNSATVYHLHYHIVVSSGEAADAATIPARHLFLIEEVFAQMKKFAAESGGDPLEHLDRFREYVDVYREAKKGKAVPIRAKFSNKVGQNRVDESK